MLAGLALPTLAGYLIIGGWQGALAGLVWGGGVRVFLLHHVTFSINSICHFFGRRRFASRDESRNVWWLSRFSASASPGTTTTTPSPPAPRTGSVASSGQPIQAPGRSRCWNGSDSSGT